MQKYFCKISLMEERLEFSTLLDFYGELLTEKQRYILNLYYNEDFSLAEISEHTNTSRQAIYDIIKRCNKLLLHYEIKLKLSAKYKEREEVKNSIINKIQLLKENTKDSDCLKILDGLMSELIDNI